MILETLKRLSPVPIEFVCGDRNYLGRYYHEGNYEDYPCIKIINELSNDEKLSVLAHEIGHALCFEKKCECVLTKDYIKRETHACEYQLSWLLKHKQLKSLEWSMKTLKKWLNRYDHYVEVAQNIMKLKLWQKCLDYVNSTTTGAESEVTDGNN